LPAFDAVFSAVDGPPTFLDPEATRPIAQNRAHLRPGGALPGPSSDDAAPGDQRGEFDVANLAPKLSSKHKGVPAERQVGVIQATAKLYSKEGRGTAQVSAAAIAMMGGNVDNMDAGAEDRTGKKRQPSAAMPVDEFLDKGSGVLLPRKRQDRKDKEKSKRQLGQSSHSAWKTEAEMVLRQQYD